MNTPLPDVSVAVPRQWATHSEPERGVLLAARARVVPASGFPPSLLLVPADVGELSRDAWRAAGLAELERRLEAFALEDDDAFDLDGLPVVYLRFAHRVAGVDVLCDQWQWLVDGMGVVLTGSVAREDYADYCEVFEGVAATVSFARRAA